MICRLNLAYKSKRGYSTASSTFQQLGISSETCQKLKSSFNVTRPTLAQEQFIPPLVKGTRDLLLRDHTGTGKTFGTSLSLASLIPKTRSKYTSVHTLYIVPNQELAYQIGSWMKQMTSAENQIQLVASSQVHDLGQIPHTVVGTPGRILYLASQGKLPLHGLERLVLDEADQALSLPKRYATVREQQKRASHPKPAEVLLDQLTDQRHQTMISSATLNRPLRYFLSKKEWVRDPLFLDLAGGSQLDHPHSNVVKHHCLIIADGTIRNIQQNKQDVKAKDTQSNFDDLDDRMIESIAILQNVEPVRNGILFVDPTVSVAAMKKKLEESNIKAEDIKEYESSRHHGQTPPLWIATEFTARGIDIPGVSHVFILGKPSSVSSYLHMAGRTGRLGPTGFAQGKVISLVREHGWTESKLINMYDLLNIPIEKYDYVE